MLEIDPAITEDFLRSQPGVFEAYAWLEGGRLIAQVTIAEGSEVSARELQVACKIKLGQRQTPGAINLIQSRLRAA